MQAQYWALREIQWVAGAGVAAERQQRAPATAQLTTHTSCLELPGEMVNSAQSAHLLLSTECPKWSLAWRGGVTGTMLEEGSQSRGGSDHQLCRGGDSAGSTNQSINQTNRIYKPLSMKKFTERFTKKS